jgi:anthranilate synthase component 1
VVFLRSLPSQVEQAGAGVVLDSIPLSEHNECVNKATALLRAAEDAGRYDEKDAR